MRATGGKMVSTPGLAAAAAGGDRAETHRRARTGRGAACFGEGGFSRRLGRAHGGRRAPRGLRRSIRCPLGFGRRQVAQARRPPRLPRGALAPCWLGTGDVALPSLLPEWVCDSPEVCPPLVLQAYLLIEEDIRDLAASDDYR